MTLFLSIRSILAAGATITPSLFVAAAFCLCPAAAGADNPFAATVRPTPPRTPEEERLGFHLPPGFEIQLVAAEPDIGKPMNIAFDAQGRLWLTQSREYPFPLPVGQKGRDKIMVLSDFAADGRARKIAAFADGLNIPIGLYPYRNGVIAFSIPYIHFLQDTDGDGRADKDEILLGRFGFEKDTHGLTSNFRRGYDGWLYADHGFNNDSVLTARDGSTIRMNSGNVYRFRLDGSHVEQFTWGLVNPFGLMFDPLGDLFASDCETKPDYLLLRGAYYPSFGKPDDGLGFAPEIMHYMHGSTAMAGMVFYAATNFPSEFRGNTFVGNVVTSRINRDSFRESGSTRTTHEEPDLVISDDPWFRPVNLELGPDGAIYVADFYNRIIGHYEVPLTHPGRDRERGRIWRIVYRGNENASGQSELGALHEPARTPPAATLSHPMGEGRDEGATALMVPTPTKKRHELFREPKSSLTPSLASMNAPQLVAQLADANITVRMLATDELTDRIGPAAIKPVERIMRRPQNPFQKLHGLWVLHRLGALDLKTLTAAARDPDRGVRTHAMRVLSETTPWTAAQRELALAGLRDPDAYVQRTAADALGQHPAFENLRPLLDLRHRVPAEDTLLAHTARMALRNQLRPAENLARVPLSPWSEADEGAVADVALGVHTPEAGSFLLRHIQTYPESRETLEKDLRHIARYAPGSRMEDLARFTRQKFASDVDFQLALFKSIQQGAAQRGLPLGAGARDWGAEMAGRLLASIDRNSVAWVNTPIEGMTRTANPWVLQKRRSADGDAASSFLSSLPLGEHLTGVLRSPSFAVPGRLSFFMAGHDGFPDKPPQKKDLIRLRAAETGEVLAESHPPRNDTAQPFSWELSRHVGKQGYLEIVDGDDGGAYAWLAVGRFDPPVVQLPSMNPSQVAERQQAAAELAGEFRLAGLEPQITQLLETPAADADARAAAAKAMATLNPVAHLAAMNGILLDATEPLMLREKVGQTLAGLNSAPARALLVEALRSASHRLQVRLALALASNADGAEVLLQAIADGKASPQLLRERTIQDRLAASKPANLADRVATLTKGLSPTSEKVQALIDQRRAAFSSARASAALGAKVFETNCRVCHTIDGGGGHVGPTLDGVGNRGVERLVEDILDPSRNVDVAFRASLITLKNGDVISGLARREEGELLVLADSTGKEITVPKKDIQERTVSETSLMPDNFSEIISPEDFNHLLAFLLAHGTRQVTNP
ncbi:MAG: PVC-type heme-binding CxxCH protein [Limisphaerales bacterium]